ncbi:hypothetical protein EYF80_038234 [Liparis tanakae]|uniref:Uncharacterized protein n=1 Tax=Liparis tanakae TaxID=230148 RepID=A0A4Z2GEG2_9TELE|nr:hypothetical protein EYF80_038234 [Liparis tanakae]
MKQNPKQPPGCAAVRVVGGSPPGAHAGWKALIGRQTPGVAVLSRGPGFSLVEARRALFTGCSRRVGPSSTPCFDKTILNWS